MRTPFTRTMLSIDELLIGDVGVRELRRARRGQMNSMASDGSARIGAELIQDRDVVPVEGGLGRNFVQKILQFEGQEQIKTLGRALVDRAGIRREVKRISQSHLQHDLVAVQDEGRRRVIHKMKLRLPHAGQRVELSLELGLQMFGVRRGCRRGTVAGGNGRSRRQVRSNAGGRRDPAGAAGEVLLGCTADCARGGMNLGFTRVRVRRGIGARRFRAGPRVPSRPERTCRSLRDREDFAGPTPSRTACRPDRFAND